MLSRRSHFREAAFAASFFLFFPFFFLFCRACGLVLRRIDSCETTRTVEASLCKVEANVGALFLACLGVVSCPSPAVIVSGREENFPNEL